MGIAALICWLVTAFGGLYLLAVWLIENDVTDEGGTASRLYGPVVLGHVLLALTGLVVWVLYLISDSDTMGWAALAILGSIAALGLTMFARWIPVRASFAAAEARVACRRSSTSRPNGPSPCPWWPATACSPSPRSPWCCSPCSGWVAPRAHGPKPTAVVFAPLITTATVSPGAAWYAPDVSAASAAQPPGSATSRSRSHSSSWAWRMASSLTSTAWAASVVRTEKGSSPTRRAPSESAAAPPTGASTGRPAFSAWVRLGASSGSAPTTRTRPAYPAAIPASSPPPPTLASTVTAAGACPASSVASVPAPRMVSA